MLKNGTGIGAADYVEGGSYDLLVIPASREFGFAGFADAVPVAAATARVAVEYVRTALIADAQRVQRRAFALVYRVPAARPGSWAVRLVTRTVRLATWAVRLATWAVRLVTPVGRIVTCIRRPAVGGAEHLVVLLAGPCFCGPGARRRDVAMLVTVPDMPVIPGFEVVGPIQRHQSLSTKSIPSIAMR